MATIPSSILDGLNPDQAQAVSALSGPVLVVAGPGSGKTRVLTHRIAALVATGTAPQRIVALTFTNKAAAEMRTRLEKLLPPGTAAPWAGTFHSLCARLLRTHAVAAGLPAGFTIIDTDDATRLVRRLLTDAAGTAPENGVVRETTSAISKMKNRLGTYRDLDPVTAKIAAAYDAELARTGRVDFDDLLVKTRNLLVTNPDVAAQVTSRIAALHVDEYQDTNPVQYDIAKALAPTGEIFAVGDAQQSIYGFRNADARVIDTFLTDFPGTTVIRLGQNYRSSGAIVALAAALIEPDPAAAKAGIWTAAADGQRPVIVACPDDLAEASFVVNRVRTLHRPGDVAVLVRTNAQTRTLEEALVRAGMPYDVIGALKFYDRAEVKDALAWMRCIVNPADASALTRAAAAPRRGVGDGALALVDGYARLTNTPIVDALIDGVAAGVFTGRFAEPLAALAKDLTAVRAASLRSPADALKTICGPVGLSAHHRKNDQGAERVANLDELIAAAEGYGSDLTGAAATAAWLEHVALLGGADAAETTGGVKLMTAHAAKGREFPHVFVCGVEEGLFPHERTSSAADVAEERRLLYVAVTRAEQTLVMTWCAQRMRFGTKTPAQRSRFLNDIAHLADAVSLPGAEQRPGLARTPWTTPRRDTATRTQPRAARRSSEPWTPSAPPAKPVVAPGPRLDPAAAVVGTQVRHSVFGVGTITARSGTRATVDFAGTDRILDLAMAPLELA